MMIVAGLDRLKLASAAESFRTMQWRAAFPVLSENSIRRGLSAYLRSWL
jgi:hypothetical protein